MTLLDAYLPHETGVIGWVFVALCLNLVIGYLLTRMAEKTANIARFLGWGQLVVGFWALSAGPHPFFLQYSLCEQAIFQIRSNSKCYQK